MSEGVDARGLPAVETDRRVDQVLSLLLERRKVFYEKSALGYWLRVNNKPHDLNIEKYRRRAEKLVGINDYGRDLIKLSKQKKRDFALIDRHLTNNPDSILKLKRTDTQVFVPRVKPANPEQSKILSTAPLERLFEIFSKAKTKATLNLIMSSRTNHAANLLFKAREVLGSPSAEVLIKEAEKRLNTITNEADRETTRGLLSRITKEHRQARMTDKETPEDITKLPLKDLNKIFTVHQQEKEKDSRYWEENRRLLEELSRRTNGLFGQLYYLPVKEKPAESQALLNLIVQKVKYIQNPEIKKFLTKLVAQKTVELYRHEK